MHSRILLLVLAALLTPALADEGHQQAKQLGQQNDSAFEECFRIGGRAQRVQPVHIALRIHPRAAKPGDLDAGERQRATQQRLHPAASKHCRQVRSQPVGGWKRERAAGFRRIDALGFGAYEALRNAEQMGRSPGQGPGRRDPHAPSPYKS